MSSDALKHMTDEQLEAWFRGAFGYYMPTIGPARPPRVRLIQRQVGFQWVHYLALLECGHEIASEPGHDRGQPWVVGQRVRCRECEQA